MSSTATSATQPDTDSAIHANATPSIDKVQIVVNARCLGCHATQGSIMPIAPKGLILETPEQIERAAALIHQQTVVLRVMPPGNITQMTEDERQLLQRWSESRGPR